METKESILNSSLSNLIERGWGKQIILPLVSKVQEEPQHERNKKEKENKNCKRKIKRPEKVKCFLEDHRELLILQKKFRSNLELEKRQTMELLKLSSLNILKDDIKQVKKAVMEHEIMVRRLKIEKRSFCSDSVRERRIDKMPDFSLVRSFVFLNFSKMRSTRNRMLSFSSPSIDLKSSKNLMLTNTKQRQLILRGRKNILNDQIRVEKRSNQQKIQLIKQEIQLIKQQQETIRKSSQIVSSEISKIISSINFSEVKSSYYVRTGKVKKEIQEVCSIGRIKSRGSFDRKSNSGRKKFKTLMYR